MNFDCKDLRDLARGQPCQFEIAGVCNRRDDTSVWCHSNESRHGKGRGIKAHDVFGAIGCSACHHWYDVDTAASRSEKTAAFLDAMGRTWLFLWGMGLVGVVSQKARHLPAARRREPTICRSLPKILPRL